MHPHTVYVYIFLAIYAYPNLSFPFSSFSPQHSLVVYLCFFFGLIFALCSCPPFPCILPWRHHTDHDKIWQIKAKSFGIDNNSCCVLNDIARQAESGFIKDYCPLSFAKTAKVTMKQTRLCHNVSQAWATHMDNMHMLIWSYFWWIPRYINDNCNNNSNNKYR